MVNIMKNNFTSLIVFFMGITLSASASATNRDIMNALYEKGTAPATTEAFANIDFNTRQCIGSRAAHVCSWMKATSLTIIILPESYRVTPPAGPLLPGKTEDKLFFGEGEDIATSYDFVTNPQVVGLDLTLTNPVYRAWVDGNNGTTHFIPAQLFARISGDYIAFRVFIEHTIPGFQNEEYFGYCYYDAGKKLIW